MVISKKLQDAINEQINKELYSAYIYLAMSAYCTSINLNGFARWFKVQFEEEQAHAFKFMHFVHERRGRVLLKAIEEPQLEFKSIEDVFEITLKHEEFVTASIYSILELATAEKDHATVSFLKWFVDEQVEEEATADEILQKLLMIKGNPNGLMALDNALGKRKAD